MKRAWMGFALLLALAATATAQESLGEMARKARVNKQPATKVYTNDNLPHDIAISVTGQAEPEAKKADVATAAPDDAKKPENDFHKNIAEQKKTIADLQREIDLMQREYKVRAAVYYADAGSQLRDPKKWADDERKYQSDLADRQKQLADAQEKLDNLRESGRKAGLPSSALE